MIKVRVAGTVVGKARSLTKAQEVANEVLLAAYDKGVYRNGDSVPVEFSEGGRVLWGGSVDLGVEKLSRTS